MQSSWLMMLIKILVVGLVVALPGCSWWTAQPPPLPRATPEPTIKLAACLHGGTQPPPLSLSTIFSDTIPHDANTRLLRCDRSNDPAIKQVYDLLSWQTFLAVNWPRNEQGDPLALGDETAGHPTWLTWKESYEVFQADGSPPAPWGSPRTAPAATQPPLPGDKPPEKTTRILYELDKLNNGLDQDKQIGDKVLWDQNGNPVYYEILINEQAFNTIAMTDTQLYELQGQISYYHRFQPSDADIFSSGVNGLQSEGAIELKLAWKILDPDQGDIPERFFHMNAIILAANNTWITREVGLVGMHISHKTASADNWVWSTFEQIDNLAVDPQTVAAYAQKGEVLKPSFFDPDCKLANGNACPVNVVPTPDAKGVLRTQVQRVLPITDSVASLNTQVQAYLGDQNSIWQYYRLIDTQYPTGNPNGPPTPPLMTNPVIETYDQRKSCMTCHAGALLAVGCQPGRKAVYKPLGDFSWLLVKAQWAASSLPANCQ